MRKAGNGNGVKRFDFGDHRSVLVAAETSCKPAARADTLAGMQRLKLKIQLYCGDEIAMGPGKADLLDAITMHGSISAAARAMDMSYRRAWLLVDAMNRCWCEPLVETSPGSTKGGGARLTSLGADVLHHYRSLQERLQGTSDCADYAALAEAMLPEPKVSQKD
jgi:molybdate transport system regulatory protein